MSETSISSWSVQQQCSWFEQICSLNYYTRELSVANESSDLIKSNHSCIWNWNTLLKQWLEKCCRLESTFFGASKAKAKLLTHTNLDKYTNLLTSIN